MAQTSEALGGSEIKMDSQETRGVWVGQGNLNNRHSWGQAKIKILIFLFFFFKPEFHKSPKTYNLLTSPLAVAPFPIHPEPAAACCVIRKCRSHAGSVGHQYLAPKTEPSTH